MTTAGTFLTEHYDWIVLKPIRIGLILVVALILTLLMRRIVRRLATRLARSSTPLAETEARSRQRAKTLASVFVSVTTVVIWALAVMLSLGELEVDLGPLLAGAGVLGIALGFGAQRIVRDFLSGLFVIIEDQYGVGDVVDVGEASGVVEQVTLRATRIRALNGTLWHVPNGEIRRAGNMSQYWARVVLDVPVAYDADVEEASALIKRVADRVWQEVDGCEVLEEPEVWGVEDFGADSVKIRLVVKTRPGSQWGVARQLRARLKETFDEAGLEIPFPQRTVWLRTEGDKATNG